MHWMLGVELIFQGVFDDLLTINYLQWIRNDQWALATFCFCKSRKRETDTDRNTVADRRSSPSSACMGIVISENSGGRPACSVLGPNVGCSPLGLLGPAAILQGLELPAPLAAPSTAPSTETTKLGNGLIIASEATLVGTCFVHMLHYMLL